MAEPQPDTETFFDVVGTSPGAEVIVDEVIVILAKALAGAAICYFSLGELVRELRALAKGRS